MKYLPNLPILSSGSQAHTPEDYDDLLLLSRLDPLKLKCDCLVGILLHHGVQSVKALSKGRLVASFRFVFQGRPFSNQAQEAGLKWPPEGLEGMDERF
jgi:hypothetical protein